MISIVLSLSGLQRYSPNPHDVVAWACIQPKHCVIVCVHYLLVRTFASFGVVLPVRMTMRRLEILALVLSLFLLPSDAQSNPGE